MVFYIEILNVSNFDIHISTLIKCIFLTRRTKLINGVNQAHHALDVTSHRITVAMLPKRLPLQVYLHQLFSLHYWRRDPWMVPFCSW